MIHDLRAFVSFTFEHFEGERIEWIIKLIINKQNVMNNKLYFHVLVAAQHG